MEICISILNCEMCIEYAWENPARIYEDTHSFCHRALLSLLVLALLDKQVGYIEDMMNTRKYILLIEPDADVCRVTTTSLMEEGLIAASAGDCTQASDLLPSFRPDVVLLDKALLGAEKEAFLTIYREIMKARIPLLLLRDRAASTGELDMIFSNACVQKPIIEKELRFLVNKMLSAKTH